MSEVRDYVHAGQLQAEWEERTGRVDHGIWSRHHDEEDDSGDWHEEHLISRYFGETSC